jgi:hypothetical protein
MSLLSQIIGAGGLPVGATLGLVPNSILQTLAGNQIYLQSGPNFIQPAASYPTAASLDSIRIVGVQETSPINVNGGNVHNSASNGSVVVIAIGDATNVLVSTNGGQTIVAVAHNNPNPVVDVFWTGSQWITVGNSTSAMTTSYSSSSTAASFTNGTSVPFGTTMVANTVQAGSWNGSASLYAAQASNVSSACMGVIVSGTSASLLTSPSPAANMTWCRPVYDGTDWYIGETGGANGGYVAGANPTGGTVTFTTGSSQVVSFVSTSVVGSTIYGFGIDKNFYKSTNHGISFSVYTPTQINGPSITTANPWYNGGNGAFFAMVNGAGFTYTTDFQYFYYRQVNLANSGATAPQIVLPTVGGGCNYFINGSQTKYWWNANNQISDYVGINTTYAYGQSNSQTTPAPTMYVRIQ